MRPSSGAALRAAGNATVIDGARIVGAAFVGAAFVTVEPNSKFKATANSASLGQVCPDVTLIRSFSLVVRYAARL
jgi:hypothetical protein